MFLRDSKASRKVKNFLEKSQACEKLLLMISKSRGSIFRGIGKSKPLNLLKKIMSDQEIESLVSSDHTAHFESLLEVFKNLKESMMTEYES